MKNSYKVQINFNIKDDHVESMIIAEFCYKSHALKFADMIAHDKYHALDTIFVLDQRKKIIARFDDEYFNDIYNVEDNEGLPF